ILLDGSQQTFLNSYRSSETALRNSRARVLIMSGTPRFVIETFGTLFIAALALYYTATKKDGLSTALPILGAVALSAQRLIPVMQQLYTSWACIAGGRSSVGDALDLLEQPMPAIPPDKSVNALPFESEIHFDEVSFQYTAGSPEVVSKIRLTIPKGSRLGVIGETGSGKSTFLDLVMGLMLPTSGEIRIDCRKLDATSMRAWQGQIAHVPQSIYLADSSVAANIAFGQRREEIDLTRVVAAAKTAQIHEVIEKLPSGYASFVGERGVRLSGGQRQRIGIARALYKQSSVIVLDEATSALDGETERAVMNAIHDLPQKITLLIVAHRYSTLKECSSVIRIRNRAIEIVEDFQRPIATQRNVKP
ncbi:MAG TPA: ATP-binding cassette domain-containing protein, partial [Pirellula sp.]|nr:ATP-binding cassette domain-containing protein [Pirellula sp.]